MKKYKYVWLSATTYPVNYDGGYEVWLYESEKIGYLLKMKSSNGSVTWEAYNDSHVYRGSAKTRDKASALID